MAWAKSFPPCLHLPEHKHTMDGHLQEVFGVIVAHRKIASKISRRDTGLHVLAYNLKRVMKIMGIGPLIQAMSAA